MLVLVQFCTTFLFNVTFFSSSTLSKTLISFSVNNRFDKFKTFFETTFLPFFSFSFPLVLLFSWLLLLSSSDWRNCRSVVCCDSLLSANRLYSILRRVLLRAVFYVLEAFSCSDNSPGSSAIYNCPCLFCSSLF